MRQVEDEDITRLLDEIRQAPEQFERLIPLLHDDLKRISHNQRASAGYLAGPTLQTTALVNEAFLKLHGSLHNRIESRVHFRRLMGQVMRQLIIDYARRSLADKRGGQLVHEELSDRIPAEAAESDFTLALEAALERLEAYNPRTAEVMVASIYGGCTHLEIAEMHALSERTVRRELQKGRAWLIMELEDEV